MLAWRSELGTGWLADYLEVLATGSGSPSSSDGAREVTLNGTRTFVTE